MSANLADITLTLNTTEILPVTTPLAYMDYVVLQNVSPYACHAAFGGYAFTVPAWYSYPVPLRDSQGNLRPGVSTPFTITPYLQTIPGVGFTSILQTQLYMQGEQPPSLVPTPLGGGPIDLTQATSLLNTGYPAGNNVVFSEPVGDNSNQGTVSINNEGQMTLGDASYAGLILIEDTNPANQTQLRGGQVTIVNNNAAGGPSLDLTQIVGSVAAMDILNAKAIRWKNSANVAQPAITVDGSNVLHLMDVIKGTDIARLTASLATFLPMLDIQVPATVHNGSVSGSLSVYFPLWGAALKVMIAVWSNYEDSGVPSIAFPSPASSWGVFAIGNTGALTCAFGNSGTGAAMSVITALASGGGTSTGVTNLAKNSIGMNDGTSISQFISGSVASVINAVAIYIGV